MRHKIGFIVFVSLLSLSAAPPPMNPEAATELSAAITILKTRHMNRDRIDWATVEAAAFEAAKNATTAAETYPAIRSIIKQLGEKHTHLLPADWVKARNSGVQVGNVSPPYFKRPEAWLLAERMVLLRVPGFESTEANDRSYVSALRSAIRRHAATGVCRFVVDLRGNGGGNLYPMLNGLKSLLGSEPYGFWVISPTARMPWRVPDRPLESDHAADYADPPPALPNARIAVLIDAETGSSGEFTAMAFEGLPQARLFGEPSAGFLTANEPMALPDGGEIAVSTAWASDRLGTAYRETITPQENTLAGQQTVEAAVRWLKAQPCR